MKKVAVDVNPYARTRGDHAGELIEDYLELILRLGSPESAQGLEPECLGFPTVKTTQLVKALGVAQPTVTKMLEKLEAGDLVCIHRRSSVHLTQKGLEIAEASLERHEVVVKFLCSIGVDLETAELDSEGIEHHVSEKTLNAMRAHVLAANPL